MVPTSGTWSLSDAYTNLVSPASVAHVQLLRPHEVKYSKGRLIMAACRDD
jgi:hypothetical protein